ncbi:MAG: nucleotidyltransferase family protein [Planctomycetota bacterium]|jgi:predicted nucleotidyltransferase
MTAIIEQNRDKLVELCMKYHVAALDIFGSAATDQFDEQSSDVDLLVEFDSSVKANRFDNFFALHDELQRLLKRPVDLVEPGGLRNPYFIDSVKKTRRRLYAAS